jgi:hypothetical protein
LNPLPMPVNVLITPEEVQRLAMQRRIPALAWHLEKARKKRATRAFLASEQQPL